jgi:hypothetical protein
LIATGPLEITLPMLKLPVDVTVTGLLIPLVLLAVMPPV